MGKKNFLKGLFVAVLSFVVATIFGSSASYAEAVITRGLFTDSNDVRWEWQKTIDADNEEEPEKVSVMFYDKPSATTTVVVPSLSDVIAAASATSTLDTYYVHSADQESQDAYFTSETRRDFGSHVTELDMTNTSKVQVMGIKPILNAETEAELVFGENMVIGDGEGSLETIVNPTVTVDVCISLEEVSEDAWGMKYYACTDYEERTFLNFTDTIQIRYYNPNIGYYETKYWDDLSTFEQKSYQPKPGDLVCKNYDDYYQRGYDGIQGSYVNDCFVDWKTAKSSINQEVSTGVFAGYKLKLTNLENVKYLGWYAFQHATLNESSRAITINANQTAGEGVFSNTNVNSVTILGNEVFPRMFANCNDLSVANIDFGAAETVSYGAFENANLNGVLDLSNTNVKNILGFAFKNTALTGINIEGVEKLDYEAFANNKISELYLPKSLKDMNTGRIFAGNKSLTKLTVAFDMMQRGMMTPLHYALGESIKDQEDCVAAQITDLTVIAPYSADEEVDRERSPYATFVGYRQLSGYYVDFGADSNDYGRADTYKNVIAPAGFAWFTGLENITIGEGFEFIGANAFYSYLYGKYRFGPVGYHMNNVLDYVTYSNLLDDRFHVSLPEGLKGIGGNAFASHPLGDFEINLPESLEYIGGHAFVNDLFMDNDIDLPNLRYIGFQAFFVSGVHNVYLHDKLEYVGYVPFMGCWNLNDVTFDFDVFSTSMFSFGTGTWGAAMFEHPIVTWSSYGDELSRGLYGEERIVQTAVGWDQYTIKRGNIVFTEKAVTAPSSSPYWFYMTAAKTVDMSKTPWTEIPVGAFLGSSIDTLLLPEHTETIAPLAFVNARIRDELVLPDTIKSIGEFAFNNWQYAASGGPHYENDHYTYYYIDENENYYIDDEFIGPVTDGIYGAYVRGIKITKLPESLETIGYMAFYGNDLLSADLNSPNLTSIGEGAFMGTRLKNVTLGDKLTTIGVSAFQGIPTLEDIIVDCDYAAITAKYSSGVVFTDLFDIQWSYSEAVRNLDHGVRAKSITFTNNAVTDPTVGQYQPRVDCPYGVVPDHDYYCYSENHDHWEYRDYADIYYPMGLLYNAQAETIDLSGVRWSTIPRGFAHSSNVDTVLLPSGEISAYSFYGIEGLSGTYATVKVPANITSIGTEAFQYSKIQLEGLNDNETFTEGLETIGHAAFYGADIHGDLIIPESVQAIGYSAFNAGDTDTHYDTVTIKADLDYADTSNQAVFQMFWNAKMDKLVIESSMLPVLGTLQGEPVMPADIYDGNNLIVAAQTLRADGEPEFHGMTMREVVVTALPEITANAFEECAELEKVTFAGDANLNRIDKYAFNNVTKLKQVVFGEANNGHDINIEEYAFNNTAIESLGTTESSDFNLAAANFHTVNEHVFSNMPKLKTVEIPNNFNIDESMANADKFVNGAHITSFTFADDPELESVIIGYQIAEIRDGAFLNDEKLAKMFIWGNAEIQESDDLIRDFNNTTIPKGTIIFAYSDAPAEGYANAESRDNYEGKFYALDEVLYLTTNKTYVVLNDDKDDFDKTDLKLYALRRDGVILESDDWQEYTTAFPRSTANINFEEGRGAVGDDSANIAAIVYDAPKPFNTISLANENFANVSFEFVAMPSNISPLVLINYPDGYTGNIRTATLASMTKEEEEEYLRRLEEELEVPNTGAFLEVVKTATPIVSISAIVVAGVLFIVKKRR